MENLITKGIVDFGKKIGQNILEETAIELEKNISNIKSTTYDMTNKVGKKVLKNAKNIKNNLKQKTEDIITDSNKSIQNNIKTINDNVKTEIEDKNKIVQKELNTLDKKSKDIIKEITEHNGQLMDMKHKLKDQSNNILNNTKKTVLEKVDNAKNDVDAKIKLDFSDIIDVENKDPIQIDIGDLSNSKIEDLQVKFGKEFDDVEIEKRFGEALDEDKLCPTLVCPKLNLKKVGTIINFPKYIGEFMGSFILGLVAQIVSGNSNDDLIVALTLCMLIYTFGGIYNPTLTIALLIRHKLKILGFIAIIFLQSLGVILGSMLGIAVDGSVFIPLVGNKLVESIFAESFFAIILVVVFLQVITSKKLEDNKIYGLSIASVILIGTMSFPQVQLNIAVLLTQSFIDLIMTGSTLIISQIWVYFIAHVMGVVFGVIIYFIINIGDLKTDIYESYKSRGFVKTILY